MCVVKKVEHYIGISLVAGCENHNLITFICTLEALNSVGPNVNPCLNCLSVGEGNRYLLIIRVPLDIINAVYQSFIKVEDDGLLNVLGSVWW